MIYKGYQSISTAKVTSLLYHLFLPWNRTSFRHEVIPEVDSLLLSKVVVFIAASMSSCVHQLTDSRHTPGTRAWFWSATDTHINLQSASANARRIMDKKPLQLWQSDYLWPDTSHKLLKQVSINTEEVLVTWCPLCLVHVTEYHIDQT